MTSDQFEKEYERCVLSNRYEEQENATTEKVGEAFRNSLQDMYREGFKDGWNAAGGV